MRGTYEDALKLCVELGLLEAVLGPDEWGYQLTQNGVNVVTCLDGFRRRK